MAFNKKVENWVKFDETDDDDGSKEFDDFTKHRLEELQQFNEFTKNRVAKKCGELSRLDTSPKNSSVDKKSFMGWSPKILGKY